MRVPCLVLIALAAAPAAVAAQSGSVLMARGVEAYRTLEWAEAARLLRSALEKAGADALPMTSRPNAWTYLGATEFFLERYDSARAAFARALSADPRHDIDRLIFPPEVTSLFDQVRRRSYFVRTVAARDTTIQLRSERYTATLLASTPHDIVARLVTPEGRVVRRLYAGPVVDSLVLAWDGLDDSARPVTGGPLELRVTSRGAAGERESLQLRLQTRLVHEDTLVPPPRPQPRTVLPEDRPGAPAWLSLAGGLAGGALAIAMPELISQNQNGRSLRFVVGSSLGFVGIIGFVTRRSSAAPDTRSADAALLAQWQREVERVRAENQQRRQSARLQITSIAVPVEERNP